MSISPSVLLDILAFLVPGDPFVERSIDVTSLSKILPSSINIVS